MSRSVVGSALGAGSVGTGDGIPVVGARVGGVSVGPSVGAAVVGATVGPSVGVAPGIGAQPAPRQTPPQHVPAQYEPGQLHARASASSKRIRCLTTGGRHMEGWIPDTAGPAAVCAKIGRRHGQSVVRRLASR